MLGLLLKPHKKVSTGPGTNHTKRSLLWGQTTQKGLGSVFPFNVDAFGSEGFQDFEGGADQQTATAREVLVDVLSGLFGGWVDGQPEAFLGVALLGHAGFELFGQLLFEVIVCHAQMILYIREIDKYIGMMYNEIT